MQDRSEYVQRMRSSFKEEVPDKVQGFWKLRLFLSILLFVSFVICDKMNVELFGWNVDRIVEQLQTGMKIQI